MKALFTCAEFATLSRQRLADLQLAHEVFPAFRGDRIVALFVLPLLRLRKLFPDLRELKPAFIADLRIR